MENQRATGVPLGGLWDLIQSGERPFSAVADTLRRQFHGRGLTPAERGAIDANARQPRPMQRRYIDATRGDVLPFMPNQGLRLTISDDEDDDASQLGEVSVRVPESILALPAGERAQEIERLRWQQIEEPRRDEWAPGSVADRNGLESLFHMPPSGGR